MNTDGVIELIARIHERANELITLELDRRGASGLVPSHGSIFAKLYEHGPLPMNRLATLIGRKKNTVTTLVRKLEAAGFVVRRDDPADSRVTLIALTPKAEAFKPEFLAISRILLSRMWGDMDVAERESLSAGLKKVASNLG